MTRNRFLMTLFSLSLFMSAGLMFSVQPMIGKMLLPVVGGTPAGWIVAMAFFQLALLAGYALAYGLSRLAPVQHGVAYVFFLALGMLLLPVTISAAEATDTLGAGGTFLLLATAIGLPFMALATTATTLQRLFTATDHPAAHDPYFLYAASNLGSFAGLLLYPLLIEPRLTLALQNQGWLMLYGVLVVLAGVCLLTIWRQKNADVAVTAALPAVPLARERMLRWVMWGFIPASLLMGYTSFITRDIYSAPLIWVVPLAIYLLTFVLAFRSPALISAARLAPLHLVAVGVSLILIVLGTSIFRTTLLPIFVHLLALGAIAMTFHVRLYEDRPLGDDRHLAAFYLLISLGGALAGLFNAFIAPVIFNQSLELPLVLLASLALHPWFRSKRSLVYYISVGLTLLAVFAYSGTVLWDPANSRSILFVGIVAVMIGTLHPRALLLAGIVLMTIFLHLAAEGAVARSRNFYGNILIYDRAADFKLPGQAVPYTVRYINHGTTMHGFQVLNAPNSLQPTSYYGAVSSVYQAINPGKIAVLGLGTGTMHCLGSPDSATTFFEIDPAVVDAAQTYFTFLAQCQPQPPRILLGDGRIEMQKLAGERFDLIAIDVFSSDYIPAHMMTREALALYLDRLTAEGVILFHISNNFFDLAPVLSALAADAGLHSRLLDNMQPTSVVERASRWLMVSPSAASIERITAADPRWTAAPPIEGVRLWTDDYTDFISILRDDVFKLRRGNRKREKPQENQ